VEPALTCFSTHSLWNSAIQRFRSVVFIGMHPAFWLAFWDRNRGYQSTCGVSKGLIRATVLSSLLERASTSNSEEPNLGSLGDVLPWSLEAKSPMHSSRTG
jgi:hypothetical protein